VTVTAPGYYSSSSSFVVSNRAGKTVTVEPGTVTVNFETVDGHFDEDRPLNANVELYEGDEFVSNISTGESGQRRVSLDVNTNYRVVVKKSGYQRESRVLSTGESDSSVTFAINRTPTLSIEDLETFGRVFRSTNLELLEAIVEHEPESIRELARLVDRNPPEVLDNVNELADYGLIELEENGSAKRPVVWYDEIDADLPLTTKSGQGPKANA